MSLIYPKNLNSKNIIAFFTDRTFPITHESIRETSSLEHLYIPIQRHTDSVRVLESLDEIKNVTVSDAVVTGLKNVLLGIKTADCVPVLVGTKDGTVVGAVHAGWRGTSMEILKKTIATIINRFSVSADDILIAIGPSIRACCYEVGYDVVAKISLFADTAEYIYKTNDKLFVDLARANIAQAIQMEVPEENIWDSKDCTCCQQHRFYSYRASKTDRRQGAFIGIKPKAEAL